MKNLFYVIFGLSKRNVIFSAKFIDNLTDAEKYKKYESFRNYLSAFNKSIKELFVELGETYNPFFEYMKPGSGGYSTLQQDPDKFLKLMNEVRVKVVGETASEANQKKEQNQPVEKHPKLQLVPHGSRLRIKKDSVIPRTQKNLSQISLK